MFVPIAACLYFILASALPPKVVRSKEAHTTVPQDLNLFFFGAPSTPIVQEMLESPRYHGDIDVVIPTVMSKIDSNPTKKNIDNNGVKDDQNVQPQEVEQIKDKHDPITINKMARRAKKFKFNKNSKKKNKKENLKKNKKKSKEQRKKMEQEIKKDGKAHKKSSTLTSKITNRPTSHPTVLPTKHATVIPTKHPTAFPTMHPMFIPMKHPTVLPTMRPSVIPTQKPMVIPTKYPTVIPTKPPTCIPTKHPTVVPTKLPTDIPTKHPMVIPTKHPSVIPTKHPTVISTKYPMVIPTQNPISSPTKHPINLPSQIPSGEPSIPVESSPTWVPTQDFSNEIVEVFSERFYLILKVSNLTSLTTYDSTTLEQETLKFLNANIGGENSFTLTDISMLTNTSKGANIQGCDNSTTTCKFIDVSLESLVLEFNATFKMKA
ncbi:hypothetical protein ACHAXS_004164, partial [Conticribra weissflogii]